MIQAFNVIFGYMNERLTYSILRVPIQVFFITCPIFAGRLNRAGRWLLTAILVLCIVHYRAFYLGFPFLVLFMNIPKFDRKDNFWRIVVVFFAVVVFWVVAAATKEQLWFWTTR